jgi:glucose-1-phosphate thymidylyltransferase
MKGIILAGGKGTRLGPLTVSTNKHLLPIYDKPMIYYPLSTLMLAGIQEILVISSPVDRPPIENLLGNGGHLGIQISYVDQLSPRGVADALLIGKEFLGGAPVALILGDNLFFGPGLGRSFQKYREVKGCQILAYEVSDPSSYGVVEINSEGSVRSIEEKPSKPKSNLAIPGLYFYDSSAVELVEKLTPSARGELEISDLNKMYLESGQLAVEMLPRGTAWLDAGTFESLLEASKFVRTVQVRQGMKVLAPEETAWRVGNISTAQLLTLAAGQRDPNYGQYLMKITE